MPNYQELLSAMQKMDSKSISYIATININQY